MSPRKAIIVKAALFTLGFLAMSVQIIMIRDALAIFHGNELVIGISLGLWMVLTATGAYAGSLVRNDQSHRAGIAGLLAPMIILAALAYWMPPAMAYLKSEMVITGAMAGMEDIFLILLITMAPFCLLSGFLFPVLAGKLSSVQNKNLVHQSYALDSAGGILGGVAFSILVFLVPDNPAMDRRSEISNSLIFPGQEVIESTNTPFGRLTVTRMNEQLTLYDNCVPIPLGDDIIQREEQVHYVMLLHPGPQSVLMISGGAGGAAREVLKYPGTRVDYLEINPWLTGILERHAPLPEDERLRVILNDPRKHLGGTKEKYDVILLNTPDPVSAELNRFYTREFFTLIKERMNPGGMVSLSVPAAGNYMSETSRMLHSVVYNTLSDVFDHIKIIPGERDFYLATDGSLNASLWQNYISQGIENQYVNPGYIAEDLILARSSQIFSGLIPEARVNTDLRPYVYLQSYRYWANQFGFNLSMIPIVLAVLIVVAFLLLNPVSLGLFAGGFTSASLELILILWFQVLFGNAYQMTGLIFAVFMSGLVIGSIWPVKKLKSITFPDFLKIISGFAVFSLLIGLLMLLIPYTLDHWLKVALIFILVLVAGCLMGALFGMSGRLNQAGIVRAAGQAFGSDLLGAAAGTVLVAVFIIPHLGLPGTTVLLSGLNLAVAGLILLKRKTSRA